MGSCIYSEDREFIYKTVLRNNIKVNFHFVDPKCRACLAKGFFKLSASSINLRFNSPLQKLSNYQLKYLTDIDNYNHLALGACYCVESENGMGIARYIKESEKSNSAEIALTVIDKYQNMGLGTMLTCLLIKYGIANRIKYFFGYVKSDNLPMIKIFKKFNFKFKIKKNEGNLIYAELKLQKVKDFISNILENKYTDEVYSLQKKRRE